MNNTAAVNTGAYAQVRVREPQGERTLGETLSVGGAGADVVVPGVGPGTAAFGIERRKGVWLVEAAGTVPVQFNGRPLTATRDLRKDDAVSVADAQLVVTDVSRTLLRLDVHHLAANITLAPASTLASLALGEGGDEDLEIHAPGMLRVQPPTAVAAESPVQAARRRRWNAKTVSLAAGVLGTLLLGVIVSSLLESVPLDLRPGDARIRTPGTLLSIRSGDRLLMLPGEHVVRAERDGYYPAQTQIAVSSGSVPGVRLVLEKLPGKLQIDTGGIAAAVRIDGVERGRAPGLVMVPAGPRTVTLSAAHYVDYVSNLAIEGGGARQQLHAKLQPAWGKLHITTTPEGAHVTVDEAENGTTPVDLDAPSGVRHIVISSPGHKLWESSVVLKAGETLQIGPVELGQPDAHLSLRSDPAGAEVTVGGVHRGRTPLELDLPAGISHPLVLDLPGYATWTQSVFAQAGNRFALDAKLKLIAARVTVEGDPADAELLVDGVSRGRTPQSLDLSAVDHRLEIRKEGFDPFMGTITPAAGLERQVRYHLLPVDRSKALEEKAPLITSSTGYQLRVVPSGRFQMGSDRREQGRRPNEGFRQVTLERPFYFGVTEITNGQFRKFRSDHASGYLGKHSIDLDEQPVTHVTWDEAAEFCNWLSERDGLPAAYDKHGEHYVLLRPVTTGYRLPTEAEWEYAARYAGAGQVRRFAWGDAPPVPEQAGNLAGAETGNSLSSTLPGFHDDYPVVAPVGKFHPSVLGFHDLSGNVSEWTNDYYMSYVDPAPATDPLGPEDGNRHSIRGANWKTANIADLRLAWRDPGDMVDSTLGFRVARYAE